MAELLRDKLQKISDKVKEPPKLTVEEKENFNEIFERIKGWLDDALEVVLEKDREEAYRYLNLLVAGLTKVDVDYIAGVVPPTAKKEENDAVEIIAPGGGDEQKNVASSKNPVVKPDLLELINQLPSKEQSIARRLDCYRTYEELENNEATCNDCGLEKLIECIRIIDPTINPAEDIIKEVEAARRGEAI